MLQYREHRISTLQKRARIAYRWYTCLENTYLEYEYFGHKTQRARRQKSSHIFVFYCGSGCYEYIWPCDNLHMIVCNYCSYVTSTFMVHLYIALMVHSCVASCDNLTLPRPTGSLYSLLTKLNTCPLTYA